MKDLQILWSACKYHWRRFKKLFKENRWLNDGNGNHYYDGRYQRVLYWRAYQSWQEKRFSRGLCNVGTDLFEEETHISSEQK